MLQLYRDDAWLASALAAVLTGDATSRRRAVQAARKHDDDWFFALCGIE